MCMYFMFKQEVYIVSVSCGLGSISVCTSITEVDVNFHMFATAAVLFKSVTLAKEWAWSPARYVCT